ncbi:MAG TPA: bifunctional YncE family protein/alkaline phosphatase family protein [Acidobacteriaceae bacterium]
MSSRLAFSCSLLVVLATKAFSSDAAFSQRAIPETRLPNGRIVTPTGKWLSLPPFPFAIAVRPDAEQLTVPCIGWPFSLNVVDHPGGETPEVRRFPNGRKNDPDVEVLAGVAYSPDGRALYDATGESGAVDVWSPEIWKKIGRIPLDGVTAATKYTSSFAAALALSADGQLLYVLDQGNWRVVVIDVKNLKRIASLPTGSNPFALALSPDSKHLYVTNSGLFEYRTVDGVDADDIIGTGLRFPPFGYPSKAAREGVRVGGHNVAGLGSENDVRGSSLWTYSVGDPEGGRLIAKLRLGGEIGEALHSIKGGAAPSGVAADAQHVYVALAHNDAIAIISTDGEHVLRQVDITPFSGPQFRDKEGRPLRGVMPAGLAVDAGHLYVAEAGINAVGVIEKKSGKVLGHIPVGWYPSAVAVSPTGGTLYVVNSKGRGAGPNGGSTVSSDAPGHYIGELEYGSVSAISLKLSSADLANATARVLRDNEAALMPDLHLPRLKHAFLIIRENRTFDEIFGDLPGVNGDPKLARYGMQGWAQENPSLKDLHVTPNAHALALRFGTSDAFSTDSDVSADGHRWAVGVAPTPWMNLAWTSMYGGRRHENFFSAAPGRRTLGGGADAPMPEDEPEFGTLWEHLSGAGLSLRNYGETLEVEGNDERVGTDPEGQRLALNAPVPEPVFVSTDRAFPTINQGIPDQIRYTEFARDFSSLVARGEAPALTVIRLPLDHTAHPRPDDGYPYRASYIADNDLALGKITDLISHSTIWKDSAIFVTEDDAQGGVDHVDAHRSVLLVMSPYVRPGVVSHRHSSMPSIQKTIYELLGVGPLNLEDALATDLSDMFTDTPNLIPFMAVPADPRIFDPVKACVAHPKTAAEAHDLVDIDDPREIRAEFHKKATRQNLSRPNGQ